MGQWEQSAGKSDEWYTPAYIFEALDETFDLDVAAPPQGGPHVPAAHWYSERSLERPWKGFVWANPPFGGRGALEPWIAQFFAHGNGVLLTPDRTSAPWFRNAWVRASLVLFLPKVRFLKPNGETGNRPSNGTVLWSAGARGDAALVRARDAGLGVLGCAL